MHRVYFYEDMLTLYGINIKVNIIESMLFQQNKTNINYINQICSVFLSIKAMFIHGNIKYYRQKCIQLFKLII